MKKTTLTILFLMVPLVASAQLKVGMMDPDAVLDALPETAQIEAELEQYVQEQQNAFQERYQRWLDELTTYSEQSEEGLLSEEEQAQAEESLAEQQEELNNLQNRVERQIQERQAQLFNPLLERIDTAMAEVSEELGIDFVLNKSSNTGDPIVYYSSQRANDITERVIEHLTQN
ncbi:MAG: OmpH family outer membrane protein [Balneolaceae bacterium]